MLQDRLGTIMGVRLADLRDTYVVVPSASHPDAMKLMEFWEARAPDGIVMGRDVPSRAISGLLSRITVWEPIEQNRDMRVRLAGASLAKRFGDNPKGRRMSELFPARDFQDHLVEACKVVASGEPVVVDSRISHGSLEHLHLEVVLLPVIAPDRESRWVLAGTFFFG